MRSAHDAITEMAAEGKEIGTRCHAVDCDLKAFFDTVDHQKLMVRLQQRTTDSELLTLIRRHLKAGVISREGLYEEQLRVTGRMLEPPCYGSVWPVVWAFYYPQVFGILGVSLILKYLNIYFDELLDDLS
ncbi:MAG: hypothetical protein ACI9NC_005261 [Verrucomicrobiales bacterium]|jgi:hypothetical protein